MYLAISKTWENSTSSTLTDSNTSVDFFNILKQKSLDSWVSTNNVYCIYVYLTDDEKGPMKHHIRWANDLAVDNRAINNNCVCAIETKLRSMQIKLNLRAMATHVQLHGRAIIESPFKSFCVQSPETTLHLVCFCQFLDQLWNNVFS